jgi:outer membrane protein
MSANALFEPRLSVAATHTDSELSEGITALLGDSEITDGTIEMQRALPTGTRLSLSFRQNRMGLAGTNTFPIPPYSSALSLSVSQSVLKNAFGKIDRATLDYARLGEDIADFMCRREKQTVSSQIADAYWDLYAARMNYEVGCSSLVRAKTLVADNRRKMGEGLLDETDILAAEALLATREVDVLTLSNAVLTASDRLKNLINVPQHRWKDLHFVFPAADPLVLPETEVDANSAYQAATWRRPDLKALETLSRQARIDVAMKHCASLPDLSLIASISRGSSEDNYSDAFSLDETAWMVGFRFEMPLWRTAEKSAIRRSAVLSRKADNNTAMLRSAIRLECNAAARALTTARDRIAATRKAAALQKKKLDLEIVKFDQGRSGTHWIVQFEDDHAFAQMACHLAVSEYRKAYARYRLAQGFDPVDISK